MTISNGYASLAEFKAYSRITSTDSTDDGVIEDIVEAASRYIDSETCRHFYGSSETRYYSVPTLATVDDLRCLQLDDDLISITTLTNGNSVVLTTADYYLYPRNTSPKTQIWLKQTSSYTWMPGTSGDTEFVISVAGSFGYASTAPDNVKQACMAIADSLYHNRFGENVSGVATITGAGVVISPADVPAFAAQVIQSYRKRL
jgi:hypothetical protein